MRRLTSFRIANGSACRQRALRLTLSLLFIFALPAWSQPPNRTAGSAPRSPSGGNGTFGNHPLHGQHLSQWMDSHRNLPLQQQQRALENEPGFRQLRPEQQDRERDMLNRLNAMSPQQRDRFIARTEAMQQLAPQLRQQVRGAMQQLGTLPEDRRRFVARVFRDVRNMPEPQREQFLNSPQLRGQLTVQERGTLYDLITVSPYLPKAEPSAPTSAPMPQAMPPG